MASLATRKKARRLLQALGLAAGSAHVLVRTESGVEKLTVRLTSEATPRVRPTRFEGAEITYEYRKVPRARGDT